MMARSRRGKPKSFKKTVVIRPVTPNNTAGSSSMSSNGGAQCACNACLNRSRSDQRAMKEMEDKFEDLFNIFSFPPAEAKPFDEEIVKARIVFDKQNFSVILYSENKESKINNSDGLDKTPIYIAFTEKKPIFGKAAKEAFAEKPQFVVFDLIKLCSAKNAKKVNPKWGFIFFKKEDEELMVRVQTTKGLGESTIKYQLALILKHGRQIIKEKSGKRMDQIEIGFEGFVPNEILKNNFFEAAKLITLDIVFC